MTYTNISRSWDLGPRCSYGSWILHNFNKLQRHRSSCTTNGHNAGEEYRLPLGTGGLFLAWAVALLPVGPGAYLVRYL
jgi:hypothetical protein